MTNQDNDKTIKLQNFILRSMTYTVFTSIACGVFFGGIGLISGNAYNIRYGVDGVVIGFAIGIAMSFIVLVLRLMGISYSYPTKPL